MNVVNPTRNSITSSEPASLSDNYMIIIVCNIFLNTCGYIIC